MSDNLLFAKILGDPAEWMHSAFYELATWKTVELKHCPQCGALVSDPYQHKAWHLQNRR